MTGRTRIGYLAAGAALAGALTAGIATTATTAASTHAAAPNSPAAPTFAKDIAPIVYANCSSCHRPGQSAPFSLLSYTDVKKRGATIADAIERRYMPPWHAARADGFAEFKDERLLTAENIATIKAWVDAGMPSGDLTKAPAPPKFRPGWALGPPDLVVEMPHAIDVAADGPDQYHNVVIPVDLPADRWITALDFEPSARNVVHHVIFYTSPAGSDVSDDDALPGLGVGRGAGRGLVGAGRGRGLLEGGLGRASEAWGGLGGWVPGVTPRFYPDGIAQPFPKHTNLVLQMHLHPSGKPEHESGKLAFYFSKTPPKASLTGVQVPPMFGFAMGLDIPAGDGHYVMHDSFTLPVDVKAYGARAHAHYLAHEMKMIAKLPDGSTRGLLWIKNWDFSWQDTYFYTTPFALPKGTVVDTTIVYDNSDANPRNPRHPAVEVRWGQQSFDEMGSTTLLVASPPGDNAELLRAAQAQHFRQQVMRLRR